MAQQGQYFQTGYYQDGYFYSTVAGQDPVYTLQDMLRAGLQAINAISPVQGDLNPVMIATAQQALDQVLATWAAQDLLVVAYIREIFALTLSKYTYTMGPGGDFSTVRPDKLMKATIVDINNITVPVNIIGMDEYEDIPDKSAPGRPERVYCDYAYPLANLYFDVAPNIVGDSVVFQSIKPFGATGDLSTAFALPGELYRLIKWSLALELAPAFERWDRLDEIRKFVADARAIITRLHASNRIEPINSDFFSRGAYDINTDTVRYGRNG